MTDQIHAILTSLKGVNSWDRGSRLNELLDIIRNLTASDDDAGLREIDSAAQSKEFGLTDRTVGIVRYCIRTSLDQVRCVGKLEEFLAKGDVGAELSPYFRSLLGEKRRADQVLLLIDRYVNNPANAEPLFILCHDFCLRGVNGLDRPSVRDLEKRMRETSHPLSFLPLKRTSIEQKFIEESIFSSAHRAADSPLPNDIPIRRPLTKSNPISCGVLVEMTRRDEESRMMSVLGEWSKSHAVVFRMTQGSGTLVEALKAADQDWIDPDTLRIEEIGPEEAFGQLFHAACDGGAYRHERGVAWGRLDAWQSMAGLVGLRDDSSFDEVFKLALSTRFFEIKSDSRWFFKSGYDLCIATIREKSNELAVLMGTDTD